MDSGGEYLENAKVFTEAWVDDRHREKSIFSEGGTDALIRICGLEELSKVSFCELSKTSAQLQVGHSETCPRSRVV